MNKQKSKLKKEFGDKFYEGLYPCVNGACTVIDIWNWIEKNFVPKNKLQIAKEMCIKIIEYYEQDRLYTKDPFAECYKLAKETLRYIE